MSSHEKREICLHGKFSLSFLVAWRCQRLHLVHWKRRLKLSIRYLCHHCSTSCFLNLDGGSGRVTCELLAARLGVFLHRQHTNRRTTYNALREFTCTNVQKNCSSYEEDFDSTYVLGPMLNVYWYVRVPVPVL